MGEFRRALEWVQGGYAARGWQRRFREELSAPFQRAGASSCQPGVPSLTMCALELCFLYQNEEGAHAMRLLLQAGASIDSLRLGRPDRQVGLLLHACTLRAVFLIGIDSC
jgi:hypothetical protein